MADPLPELQCKDHGRLELAGHQPGTHRSRDECRWAGNRLPRARLICGIRSVRFNASTRAREVTRSLLSCLTSLMIEYARESRGPGECNNRRDPSHQDLPTRPKPPWPAEATQATKTRRRNPSHHGTPTRKCRTIGPGVVIVSLYA